MPGLADAFELVGDAIEHHLPQTHAAGMALAVTDHEETLGVVVRGFADVAAQSPVRPETRFEIGSISKQFASIVALQEVRAGTLDLHVSVNELLPWLELPEPFGPITLHHLLTHSGGLGIGMEEAPTGLGAASLLRELPPTFAPGERFWYSNDGYKLVGLALERITGSPIHELLRERLLGPLGMRHSEPAITDETRLDLAVGYAPLREDRLAHLQHPLVVAPWLVSNTADGSIVSTVIDMSAYARMLLGGGATLVDGHEVRVLDDDAFALLTTPHIETDERPFRYGYGVDVWERDGRSFVGHSGGMVGYTALLWLDRDSGLGCVAFLNGEGNRSEVVGYAIDAVREALAGTTPTPKPHPPASTAIDGADELAGTYVGPRTIELQRTSDGLRLVDGPIGVALERVPDEVDVFLVPHPARDRDLLHVVRGDDAAVLELGHGSDRFAPEGGTLTPDEPYPPAWEAFVGLYRSNNTWGPLTRVFLRGGRLRFAAALTGWLDRVLLPLEDGSFAIHETWRPERVRFDRVIEGRPTVLTVGGATFYRSFED